jgi:uncharacterized membrane protein YdbT with pleckstrin-like domain
MNEIPAILEKKEKMIWDGKPRYAPYMFLAVVIGLVIGLFAGIGLGSYLKMIAVGITAGVIVFGVALIIGNLMYKFTHYGLTDKRVIYQHGIFGRSFKSINYDDIKNASVQKGLFNWIFNTGTIQVFTGEMESTGDKNQQLRPKYDNFLYVEDAYNVLKALQENLTVHEENLYGGKNVVQRVKVI